MRAILTNFGSTGDIQPLLALAAQIKRRGGDPVLCLSPYFKERIEKLGFEFKATGPYLDWTKLQDKALGQWGAGEGFAAIMKDFAELMEEHLPQIFDDLSAACRDADVLISGPLQPAAPMVHELTQIPFASVQLTHFAGPDVSGSRELMAAAINPFRAKHRLAPISDPLRLDANSPQLSLYAMSREVRQPDTNWGSHYHILGFFFLAEQAWTPAQDLQDFMDAGDPPVIFSFGSMAHRDPEAVTQVIVEAVQQVDARALIQRGWSGLGGDLNTSRIKAVGSVPHHWLFDKAGAVVHHGGAGTTAAVWRAGVPSVIVPHAFDQPVWGELSRGLGVSAPAIPIAELTVPSLAKALDMILNQPSYLEQSAQVKGRIRAEGGAVKAVQLIEELVQKVGLSKTAQTPGQGNPERSNRRRKFLETKRGQRKPRR